MSWFRLEGRGAFHHKVLAAGNEAYGAWCRAGQWSSDQLTEGLVPLAVAEQIAKPKVWAKLIAAKLIHEAEGGYQIHDFLDFNPSSEAERARREETRERRRESGRVGGKRSGESRRAAKQDASLGEAKSEQTGSKNEAKCFAGASGLLEANGKQNEAPIPIPIPIEDPPYPPLAGAGGSPDVFALSPPEPPAAPRAGRQAASPTDRTYSDAYVAGQCDAEPSCGFSPLPASAVRLLGATAGTHAKDRFKQPLRGEAVTAWIRETSAEFRRSAEPAFSKGFSVFAFKAWLDAGRPMTRREPLPEPPKPARELPEPPPPRTNTRMTHEQQRDKEMAKIRAAMGADAEVPHG